MALAETFGLLSISNLTHVGKFTTIAPKRRLNLVFNRLCMISLMFLVVGCATGVEIGADCRTDEDCKSGLQCNTITSACETLRIASNNKGKDMGRDRSTTPDLQSDVTKDVKADTPQSDMRPSDMADMQVACEPTCSGAEKCENGTCVEACTPACVAPQVCTDSGCKFPTCAQKGDSCETTQREQGDFFCRDLGNGGICLEKCAEIGASTCGDTEYCIPIGPAEFNCEPNQCAQQSDCTTGTCLLFDNNYGRCFAAGALSENALCDLNASTCSPGFTCNITTTSATGKGTCQKVCSPWDANTGCTGGARCSNLVTPRSFSCSPNNDATGTTPYTACTTPRASCSDATTCLGLSSGNGCFKYCRPGMTDCAGLAAASVCNNHIIASEDRWGL